MRTVAGRHCDNESEIRSDGPYQAFFRGLSITDQQQYEQQTRKRNESGDDHDGVKGVCAGGGSRVRKIADQFESYDGANFLLLYR
jgi:hypothetical protein